MANWYGHARSNYFKVKDAAAFVAAMQPLDVEVWPGTDSKGVLIPDVFGLGGQDSDSGGWPSSVYDETTEEYEDIDIADLVSPHLQDGEVAVFIEVGAEKLRYITGHAIAVNNKGETRNVNLEDIYPLAKAALGPNVTIASM